MTYRLTRRTFIKLCLGTALASCSTIEKPTPTPTTTPIPTLTPTLPPTLTAIPPTATPEPVAIEAPFGIWSTLREAIRLSPDHLSSRARLLIGDGDAAAIYTFVRDNIRVHPANTERTMDALEPLWGPRATLRGGAGTMRDKADVLADLLTQAGYTAEVVEATVNWSPDTVREMLLRPVEREFNPDIDSAVVDELVAQMQSEPISPPITPEEIAARADALTQALLAQFPPDDSMYAFIYPTLLTIPVVRLEINGETRYANPFVADGEFGEHYASEKPDRRASSPVPRKIEMDLLVAYSTDPGEKITVVHGEWSLTDLLGRQIVARFLPTITFENMRGKTISDVTAFIPALILRGPDVTRDESDALSFFERAITLGGDMLEVDENEEVLVNGLPIQTATIANPADVASLQMTINEGGFPRISLSVSALDSSGQAVNGLQAGDFVLEEDGKQQGLVLTQNVARPPRVMFSFDTSDSLPEAFRVGELVSFGTNLTGQLLARYPEALISFIAVGASRPTDWFSDTAGIETTLQELSGFESGLWGNIKTANESRPDVIVLITDGQATDELTPDLRSAAARSVPVIVMGVGEVEQPTIDQIAMLTGGVALTITQPDEAVDAILSFIDTQQTLPVTLTYFAPYDGSPTRAVKLNLQDHQIAGTYDVPVDEERSAPTVVGVYLRMTQGSQSTTRTLGGYSSYQHRDPVTPEIIDEAHGALLGSAIISFEGPAPLLSPVLDDILTARLSLEPMANVLAEGSALEIYDTFSEGVTPVLPDVIAMHLPIHAPDSASYTFETTPRIVMYQETLVPDGLVRRIDLLRLSRWATVAGDPQTAFAATAARTAQLAVIESARFQTSAFALLEGQDLLQIEPYSTYLGFEELPPENLYQWHMLIDPIGSDFRMFAPRTGETHSFWLQDAGSGGLIAVLPDGSGGGGSKDTSQPFDRSLALLDYVDLIGGLMGASLGFGVWIALEKTKIQKLRAATLLIDTLPVTSNTDPSSSGSPLSPEEDNAMRDLMADIYGNLVDEIVEGAFPNYKYVGALDSIVGMLSDGKAYVIPFPFHLPTSELD
ncbi:MAG: VWA domain-containing protein [Chloroflexi bacterium]|nr:VWA domain-containing protein [Chloroflexota bacterium]